MKKAIVSTLSVIGVFIFVFIGIRALTHGFYKSPDETIIAFREEDGIYRGIELNPDKTMRLLMASSISGINKSVIVQYKITGDAVNHVAGPLYYRRNTPWFAGVMWLDGNRKPYIVDGEVVDAIPYSSNAQSEYGFSNTLLIVGDDAIEFDGVKHHIDTSVPAWVRSLFIRR